MGAGQSHSTDQEEKVFSASSSSRPISFSQDLVNHLEDNLSSPETSATRQETLDAHIQARIAAELERLRTEEQSVREQIELALERENLDREKALATSEGSSEVAKGEGQGNEEGRNLASSVALQDELDNVQKKVERFHKRRELEDYPEVKDARQAVLSCYQANPTRPLDCSETVTRFQRAVAGVEQAFVESLRS